MTTTNHAESKSDSRKKAIMVTSSYVWIVGISLLACFTSISSLDLKNYMAPIATSSGGQAAQQPANRTETFLTGPPDVTIAYTVVVTECTDDQAVGPNTLLDAAAVLKHSIHLVTQSSRYPKMDMIALTHSSDVTPACRARFQELGYQVRSLPSPVSLEEIRNPDYARMIKGSGCCGEKEFLKLYGYNMTEYPIVVQLDLDMLLLRPLDDLIDAMLSPIDMRYQETALVPAPVTSIGHVHPQTQSNGTNTVSTLSPTTTRTRPPIHAFFVRDYNANLKYKQKNKVRPPQKLQIQGGFLVLRPDPSVLAEFIELIKTGDFQPLRGWTSEGWGGVLKGPGGSDRFQGIVSYFYSAIHPNTAVDLHPCYHDVNAGPPIGKSGKCATSQSQCEDCRETNFSKIYSVHFGGCRKPWDCIFTDSKDNPWGLRGPACLRMHHAWHKVRQDFQWTNRDPSPERQEADQDRARNPENITDYYFGHCRPNAQSKSGYEYIAMGV